MSKKNFYTLVFGVIGGMLFAIGMCMALLPEWNAFTPGVVIGALGGAELLVLWLVRRKIDGKPALRPGLKTVVTAAVGILGALILGLGMCMVMVWDMLIGGIFVGLFGILLLLCLIPLTIGLK